MDINKYGFEDFKTSLSKKLGNNAEIAMNKKDTEIKSIFDEAAKNDSDKEDVEYINDKKYFDEAIEKAYKLFSSIIKSIAGTKETEIEGNTYVEFEEVYYGDHPDQDISIDEKSIPWTQPKSGLEEREDCSVAHVGDLKIYYNKNGSMDVYNTKDGQFAHFSKEAVEEKQNKLKDD